MAKKTAMVQPVPKKPIVGVQRSAPLSLEETLRKMSNDRAYTVISHKGNTWLVHFEGDCKPVVITSDIK